MAITQNITTIPTPGHRGIDSRDDFVTKQEAFQDALTDVFVSEINTVISETNTTAADITTKHSDVVTKHGEVTTLRNETEALRDEAVSAVATLPDGTINDVITTSTDTWSSTKISTDKQDTLISGTNIKTVGGNSLLGAGDIVLNAVDHQEFTTSGTWTKPAGINYVYVEVIGAGGSGSSGYYGGSGGGGGACNRVLFKSSNLASTISITVGAGGSYVVSSETGNLGGFSSFGTYCYAYGGGGGYSGSGSNDGAGGSGGGIMSTGVTPSSATTFVLGGAPQTVTSTNYGRSSVYGGGAGASSSSTGASSVFGGGGGSGFRYGNTSLGDGGASFYGGGGGAGSYTTATLNNLGGVSVLAGNGGASGKSTVQAEDGGFPGGGGGGASDYAPSGSGADGVVRVWCW